MSSIRIATRGSDLALAQAHFVADRVREKLGLETEILPIKTTGDRILSQPLAEIGGKGLFVKEIEEALLADRADLAVHSAKDLPAELAPNLTLVAFPDRADPRDALVARERGTQLARLSQGARVGTGSLRRTAQLIAARPDLQIVPLRGNVPTRIRKIEEEDLAAVVLACAGLERLGLAGRIDERMTTRHMLPAVAQGIMAVEARADDPRLSQFAELNDPLVATAAAAERGFLIGIGGDCNVPMAALAEVTPGGSVRLDALLAAHDGTRVVRASAEGNRDDAAAMGARVAKQVLAQGGSEILEALRAAERS